jgi:hypothetical protein
MSPILERISTPIATRSPFCHWTAVTPRNDPMVLPGSGSGGGGGGGAGCLAHCCCRGRDASPGERHYRDGGL